MEPEQDPPANRITPRETKGEETPKMADRLPFAVFLVSIFVLGSIYGMLADRYGLFPYPTVSAAWTEVRALKTRVFERDKTIALPDRPEYKVGPDAPAAADGLLLVVGVGKDLLNFARVIDRSGNAVHEWRLNWFEIWPDDSYLPPDRRPKSLPGELVHGAEIAPDGDLIINFDELSTVRLDPCGNVRWKLPNFGHHSVFLTEGGDIWVSAEREVEGTPGENDKTYPNIKDRTIQKLSPEGEILSERSVIDILNENGLAGLVQMVRPHWTSNTLHQNDVEVFPRTLAPGFFGPGDILISMRDVNTLLVLDPTGRKVKFVYTGEMVHQHDPDFTSGNTITVFDNHHTIGSVPADEPNRSRVLEITAPSGTVREVFRGGPVYFTHNMGNHQILPNGNLLVTVTQQGQALEIAPDGRLAWQFENDVGDGMRGLLTEVDLLPPEMDAAFFQGLRAGCGAAQ